MEKSTYLIPDMDISIVHKMHIKDIYFDKIKNGSKTTEFRLYDDKRKMIRINDTIEFTKISDLEEKLYVKVEDLYKFPTFKELFIFLAYDEEEINDRVNEMYEIYTSLEEKKHGVVGIKINLLR